MIENINLNGATVSAELHGFMYNNLLGYTGVFKYGSAMEAEIVSNNEIKIKDGLLSNCGRFMRISGYETLAIENGTSRVARTDLIVAHFETDGINETHDLRVIKGASGGAIPSYTTGDLYNGDTVNEMPLYAVHLEGLTVTGLTRMFIPLFSLDELRNNLNGYNLLINSNFKNPINQRRATSYTTGSSEAKYTIDRWMISANETLTVEDGFIRFKLNSAQRHLLLQQKIEMNKLSVPDVMTLSCKIRASQKGKFHLYDTDRYFDVDTDWKVLNITFTKEEIGTSLFDDNFRVYFGIKDYNNPNVDNLPVDSYVDIEWCKLEPGSIATPFVPRNYQEELELCKKYYMKIPGWQSAYPFRGDNNYVFVFLSGIQMRTNPTVIGGAIQYAGVNSTSLAVRAETSSTVNSTYVISNGIEIEFTIGTSVINFGTAVITSTMELDAEIY